MRRQIDRQIQTTMNQTKPNETKPIETKRATKLNPNTIKTHQDLNNSQTRN